MCTLFNRLLNVHQKKPQGFPMTAHVVNHRRAYVSLAGSAQPVQGGNIPPFPGFFGVKVQAAEGEDEKRSFCVTRSCRKGGLQIWRRGKESNHVTFPSYFAGCEFWKRAAANVIWSGEI